MRETMNIVVITGASSGMGREFAMQLDRGLHSVDEFWLIARRGSRLKEIASSMQHTVKILPLDLTNEADMTAKQGDQVCRAPARRKTAKYRNDRQKVLVGTSRPDAHCVYCKRNGKQRKRFADGHFFVPGKVSLLPFILILFLLQ